jgi:hypothetical protein
MFGGIVCTRLLSALLAVVVACVGQASWAWIRRFTLVSPFVIFGVAAIMTSIVITSDSEKRHSHRSPDTLVFRQGLGQVVASLVFLGFCSVTLIVTIVFIFRNHFRNTSAGDINPVHILPFGYSSTAALPVAETATVEAPTADAASPSEGASKDTPSLLVPWLCSTTKG